VVCLQVIGIAAQDFMKGGIRNKYEATFKSDYESYVWSYYYVPSLPAATDTFTTIQVGRNNALSCVVLSVGKGR